MSGSSPELSIVLDDLAANSGHSVSVKVARAGSRHADDGWSEKVTRVCGLADERSAAREDGRGVSARTLPGVGGSVLIELTNPSRRPEMALDWLADFTSAAERADLRAHVSVVKPAKRLPTLWDFRGDPPALSAYLNFDFTTNPDGLRVIPRETVEAIAADITDWCRFPGGTMYLVGPKNTRLSPATAPEALVEDWDSDDLRTVQTSSRTPRRLRLLILSSNARAYLQIADQASDVTTTYTDLLAGLRICAPYLRNAYVRFGNASGPHVQDVQVPGVGRVPTKNDLALIYSEMDDVLSDYVPDAYVAQVLTPSHLQKAADLDAFDVLPLGGRFLVTAKDPTPWLQRGAHEAKALAAARRSFGRMIYGV